MSTENDAAFPELSRQMIVGNLRAYRARRGLDQAIVVERMRAMGFTNWHRQTMSRVELGQRRLAAEEIIGLARALETFPAHLLTDHFA